MSNGGVLFRPRFYNELEALLQSDELKQAYTTPSMVHRELLYYYNDMPTAPLQRREDAYGTNDVARSERLRSVGHRLWTIHHPMWPISGGSDGLMMTIFFPWEVDDSQPSYGIYNSLELSIRPLDIYQLMEMYEQSDHELLVEQVKRFLRPDPYDNLEI